MEKVQKPNGVMNSVLCSRLIIPTIFGHHCCFSNVTYTLTMTQLLYLWSHAKHHILYKEERIEKK
jgi:hypothetical protein